MRPHTRAELAIAALSIAGCGTLTMAAPPVQIRTIATADDSPAEIPDDRFAFFSEYGLSIENGAVYFNASGFNPEAGPFTTGFGGAFRWDGGEVEPIFVSGASVESSDSLPLRSVHSPDRSGGALLLYGNSNKTNARTLNTIVNGEITEVLSTGDPIPGTNRTIQALDYGRTDGEQIWLRDYVWDNNEQFDNSILIADINGENLRVLVDQSSQFPVDLGKRPVIGRIGETENGRLTFLAKSSEPNAKDMLFAVDTNGHIETVADFTTTTTEQGNLIFPKFEHLAIGSISGDAVIFRGRFDPGDGHRDGLFAKNMMTGEVQTLLDTHADFPIEYASAPHSLYSPVIDGEDFAFIASWHLPGSDFPFSAFRAIMMQVDGELHRIVGFGDVLEGRIVRDFLFTQNCIENGAIAFAARFTDGTEGLFHASVIPSPGAFVMLLPFGAMPLRRRRKEQAEAASA